jgi:Cyclic nucleotide-binding domain
VDTANLDPTPMLNGWLNAVAQNYWIQKLLIHIGLDPAHVTLQILFHRLVDAGAANINFVNSLALVGAILYVITQMVRTIVPLRVIGILSIVFFIAYGVMAGAVATFCLYLLSLPINLIRLRQMLNLIRKAKVSAQGDLSIDWLRPYMSPRKYRAGEVLFHKGDLAKELFLIVTGKFLVSEINVELPPGRLMGELGFVVPENRRTQTVECVAAGEVLTITYEKLLELYFQNPEFGYYFLRLTSERLMQNIKRLEGLIDIKQADVAQVQPGSIQADAR